MSEGVKTSWGKRRAKSGMTWFLTLLSGALALLVVLSLTASSSWAADSSAARKEIPPELTPWIPWVEAELSEHACPHQGDQAICQWPGVLELRLTPDGGTFQLHIEVDRQGPRQLIGDLSCWPQEVTVDGKTHPVLDRGGLPIAELPAGRHMVEGRLRWSELPETLTIGEDLALLRVFLDETPIALLKR